MPVLTKNWPTQRTALYLLGVQRVENFCKLNEIVCPKITEVAKENWVVGACAYYRPTEIKICIDDCGYPCGEAESRNWTWPGSVTDREPYGVLAHELGHHCDYLAGKRKGKYYSEYSHQVMTTSCEKPITSYCPNLAEWFAEMFRLFVTNHGLLKAIRPKTYAILLEKWKPYGTANWKSVLGSNVPSRILRTLANKGAK